MCPAGGRAEDVTKPTSRIVSRNSAALTIQLNRIRYLLTLTRFHGPVIAGLYEVAMKLFVAFGAVTFLITGCATITRGTTDALVVNSTPQGAQVQLSNGMSCTSTPCTFKLPRKSDLQITVSKDRCQTVVTNVTHTTAGAGAAGVAGNVLVGGIIGLGVDAATGASQDLVPNPVEVTLQCR